MAEIEQLNVSMETMLEESQENNRALILAQKQMEAAYDELEAFSYTVAHDLHAPIRHIRGFISLLQENSPNNLDNTAQQYLLKIENAAHRMGELINSLLDLSQTTRAHMNFTAVNSKHLVETIVDEVTFPLVDRNVNIQLDELPPVRGDEDLLRIVWLNLVNNAVKFTSQTDDAHIQIKARPLEEQKKILFSIKDNGAGFNPAYSEKLFQVFQRLHSEREYQGTGIGLTTVKRIIQRHGGEVWAEGEEGVGATFYFTLDPVQH